jgi:anti-sigma regulatory factor (Ser/Thr protein kinase)
MASSVQKIRPAPRLLRTIGQDLIKDTYAAIVELVKNAYDADSPEAIVRFIYSEEKKRLLIRLEDHGHGMSFDTVVNKWLVPATDDKLIRNEVIMAGFCRAAKASVDLQPLCLASAY